MRSLWIFPALLLTGCAASQSYIEPPVVDMRGVDQQRYAQDLADCTQRKKDMGFVTIGAPLSNCMRERGYNVTVPKG